MIYNLSCDINLIKLVQLCDDELWIILCYYYFFGTYKKKKNYLENLKLSLHKSMFFSIFSSSKNRRSLLDFFFCIALLYKYKKDLFILKPISK